MSSADDPFGTGLSSAGSTSELAGPGLATQLFETLCYVLIEKGVLTKNDALSVIQTVAQVKRGAIIDESASGQDIADLRLLRRLFTSFEALDDRPGDVNFAGDNVLPLRPPLHGNRPEFPDED